MCAPAATTHSDDLMPTVYVASKSRHWPFWSALRSAGIPLIASWIDAEFNRTGEEPSADAWRSHWLACCEQAASADVTLMFAQEDERQMGALIEAGACLGAGKWLFLVTPHPWSFKHHPRVRCFDTLEAAVQAIMSMAAGERSRETMERGRRPVAVA
jgi:hypothetical protein